MVIGIGPSSAQSDIAFYDYLAITSLYGEKYDYYVSGHSLGGRLTQDVIYNSNEGGVFTEPTDIPEPKYSATFNTLGYNSVWYAWLENDIISQYKNTLYNYYIKNDLVGHSLGANPFGLYKRTGTDINHFIAVDKDGKVIETSNIFYEGTKVHGIELFQWNPLMNPNSMLSRN